MEEEDSSALHTSFVPELSAETTAVESIPVPELFEDHSELQQTEAVSFSHHGVDRSSPQHNPQQQNLCLKPTDQSCSSVMANDVIYSPCPRESFNKSESFLSVFSRLPPDGHEFPSSYMETEDSIQFQFCPVDSSTNKTEQVVQLASSHCFIQPPAGFEDNSQAKLASFINNEFVSGDYGAITDMSDSVYDNDEDDLPPPPLPSTLPHQHLLLQVVNEPIEFEESDLEEEEEEEEDEKSLSERDQNSPPPIPPKRLSSTTSSSSSSTEKTVITVNSPPATTTPSAPFSTKESKIGNETMSVRDKIALFTAKVEKQTVVTKQVKTITRSISQSIESIEQPEEIFNAGSVDDEDQQQQQDDEVEEDNEEEEEEEEEEDPITTIEICSRSNQEKCSDNLIFNNYSSIDSEPNLYGNRPSSSLSASSNFSKSSDDVLGHDSSDVDDHHYLKKGSSLSLDRKSFYSSKHYNENRYRLDLSSSSQLDKNGDLRKTSSTGDDRFIKSSTLDSGTRTQSMYAILESRKNTVSKLKGLVIPQIKKDSTHMDAIPDLPLIYSVDSIIKPKLKIDSKSDGGEEATKVVVVDSKMSKYDFRNETENDCLHFSPPPLPKSLPPLMETSTVPLSNISPEIDGVGDFDDRLCADTEDQESGISSIDSPNVSIHNTPPASPKEKPHRRYYHQSRHNQSHEHHFVSNATVHMIDADHHHQLSGDSTALRINNKKKNSHDWDSTDDSETSSSSDVRVTNKVNNTVDDTNRKNVLQSSRISSGKNNDHVDAKIKLFSSPASVVQSSSTTTTLVTGLKNNQRRSSEDLKVTNDSFDDDNNKDTSYAKPCRDAETTQKRNSPVSDERWMELERKYAPKTDKQESNGLKSLDKVSNNSSSNNSSSSNGNGRVVSSLSLPLAGRKRDDNSSRTGFKALAETWKQRANVENEVVASSKSSTSTTPAQKTGKLTQNGSTTPSSKQVFEETIVDDVKSLELTSQSFEKRPFLNHSVSNNVSSTHDNVVTKRERPNRASTGSVMRPTSLIETDSKSVKLWPTNAFIENEKKSPTKHHQQQQQQLSSLDHNTNRSAKRSTIFSPDHNQLLYNKSNRSTSVNDLRQMFENPSTLSSVPHNKLVNRVTEPGSRRIARENSSHIRMSSLDSTASESEPGTPAHYGSATSLGSSPAIDHYGSITSLASSTSLISPQELQQLIEEANQSLEESHEITVVVLQREIAGGSIGITLAGGADYDSKEITVNKVLNGSVADRDGRILKGDRVISINGKNLRGLTHREALCILKAPRSDCVLVLSRNKTCVPPDVVKDVVGNGLISRSPNKSLSSIRNAVNSRLNPPSAVVCTKPEIAFCPADKPSVPASITTSPVITTRIVKDSSGLGFSLDGGKDSPLGDRPLTIKKIFNGSSADKNKDLNIGDEIISINGIDVTNMARLEAWSIMKKVPNGSVSLVVNHKP